MQKKLIAIAVAALASGAVFAQSQVTVYGTVDVGVAHRSSGKTYHIDGTSSSVKSTNAVNASQAAPSIIGFTGVEDLGNGNKALFVLEAGFRADDGDTMGPFFNEQAFLGLTGGWGTAIAGRLQAPRWGFLTALDPFADGTVGRYSNVYNDQTSTNVGRVNNAVAYVSPSFGGFNVTAAYATNAGLITEQEAIGNDGDLVTYTLFPRYTNGPLDVGLVYQDVRMKRATENKQRQWTLGAAYDFGAVKLSAAYDDFRGKEALELLNDKKVRSWMLGLSAPFGKNVVKFSYNENKAKDAGKARQFALGYDYNLSKRTNFYAAYAQISNKKGQRFTGVSDVYNDATFADPQTDLGGSYRRGFQLGIKHTF
ncbi:MAG: porin [Betaproteobacteria bacterium]|nr:porin [Betaproteobacteria bacterium]